MTRDRTYRITDWLLAVAALALASAWPCVFQYTNNFQEAWFRDALLFAGIFFAAGLVCFLIALLLLRSPLKAGALCVAAVFLITNFGLMETGLKSLLPGLRGRWILLAGLLLLAGLTVLVRRWKKPGRVLCQLLCVFLGAVFLITGIQFVPRKIQAQRTRMAAVREQAIQLDSLSLPEELPNVYYYLYDEYAGPECLQHYYQATDPLYGELEDRGFSCSMDSYNTEDCTTVKLVPDLFGLSYDVPPFFTSGDGESPRLYDLFSAMGYDVQLINHLAFLDTDGAVNLTPHQIQDSICVILYENSIFPDTPLSSWFEGLPQLSNAYSYRPGLLDVLDKMTHAPDYVSARPTLTIGYVQLPHASFVYDAAGNPVSGNYFNWADPQYYLGQLYYTGDRILEAVDNILAQDPGAIIILQSDHGARLAYHRMELYGEAYDAEAETPYMQNILNCVYAGGQAIDIQGQTGVNTLITLLNETYGTEFPMVPPAQGFVYRYEDN